jgi:hypothetical protein
MDQKTFKALVDAAEDVSYRGKHLTRGHAEAIVAAVLRAQGATREEVQGAQQLVGRVG